MKKLIAYAALPFMVVACGEATSADRSANPYDTYLLISDDIGGLGADLAEDDAAARAAPNCMPNAKADLYNDVPLSEFPTDLALVRAYCPQNEW